MKKLMFSTVALLALAVTSAPALTFNTMQIAAKPKPAPAPTTTQPSPDSIPPTCPYNDPNGCGILD